MPAFPLLSENQIVRLAGVLEGAGTHDELTAWLSEIGATETWIGGVRPSKERRIRAALAFRQKADGCGNNVFKFVLLALEPVRYMHKPQALSDYRAAVNEVLAFSGLQVTAKNEIIPVTAARTVDEAKVRAGRLRAELEKRGVHGEVLHYCRADLLRQDYFDTVFEASKGVCQRLRDMTGLGCDGAELVTEVFKIDDSSGSAVAMVAINSLRTESEQSAQKGYANLLRGVVGHFRNPSAHAPKVTWPVNEQDALDLLTLVSYLHRRLDTAVVLRKATP